MSELLDRFWSSDVMVTLQGWVDTTRALEFNAIWLVVIILCLWMFWLYRLPATNTEKERPIRGAHYRGVVTAKLIKSLKATERVRNLRKAREDRLRKHKERRLEEKAD